MLKKCPINITSSLHAYSSLKIDVLLNLPLWQSFTWIGILELSLFTIVIKLSLEVRNIMCILQHTFLTRTIDIKRKIRLIRCYFKRGLQKSPTSTNVLLSDLRMEELLHLNQGDRYRAFLSDLWNTRLAQVQHRRIWLYSQLLKINVCWCVMLICVYVYFSVVKKVKKSKKLMCCVTVC